VPQIVEADLRETGSPQEGLQAALGDVRAYERRAGGARED